METDRAGAGQANNRIALPTPDALARAVELLRAGDVVAVPTETVYGLAGDALNPTALARIFEVKQRPLFDPLILHAHEAEAAFALAATVPPLARRLADRFWPGPLTLVLPRGPKVPDLATSGLPHVALRVPAHPVAQALLRAWGGPLAAPSANRFGRISPTDAAAVAAELGDLLPLILDGGPCAVGVESSVLDLTGPRPVLLRAGGVTREELEAVAGPIERAGPVEDRPTAPGQLKSHYAPRKPLRLVESVEEIPGGTDIGRLLFGEDAGPSFSGVTCNLSPRGNLHEAAAAFFRALRALDDDPRVTALYALRLPAEGLGLALNERLERAAS